MPEGHGASRTVCDTWYLACLELLHAPYELCVLQLAVKEMRSIICDTFVFLPRWYVCYICIMMTRRSERGPVCCCRGVFVENHRWPTFHDAFWRIAALIYTWRSRGRLEPFLYYNMPDKIFFVGNDGCCDRCVY